MTRACLPPIILEVTRRERVAGKVLPELADRPFAACPPLQSRHTQSHGTVYYRFIEGAYQNVGR